MKAPRAAARASRRMQQLQQLLHQPGPLRALREQALETRRMWQAAAAALPPALAGAVLPGRCIDGAWTIGASSSAVAAKLKLYAPLLLRHLQKQGWALRTISVRVQLPNAPPTSAGGGATSSPAPDAVRLRLRELRERFR